jgi:hypothetical protein
VLVVLVVLAILVVLVVARILVVLEVWVVLVGLVVLVALVLIVVLIVLVVMVMQVVLQYLNISKWVCSTWVWKILCFGSQMFRFEQSTPIHKTFKIRSISIGFG